MSHAPGYHQPPQGVDDFKVDEAGDIVMSGATMRALGLASSATAKLKRARVADGDWDHVTPMYLVPQEILREILSSLSALQAQYDQMTFQGQGQPYPGTGSSGSGSAMPSAFGPPTVLQPLAGNKERDRRRTCCLPCCRIRSARTGRLQLRC